MKFKFKKCMLIPISMFLTALLVFAICYEQTPVVQEGKALGINKEVLTVESDDWYDIFSVIYPAVNERYPECSFYEAGGRLKKIKDDNLWGVDHNTFVAVFGNPFKVGGCVKVLIVNDTVKFKYYDEPWVGTRYTTPFVLCDLSRAVELVQKKVNICPENDWATLSFSLYDIEPKWSIETADETYMVGAYSLDVDPE